MAGKHRVRTSSIEVIFEEKEDLLETENKSSPSRAENLELNSEINEISQEKQIDVEEIKNNSHIQNQSNQIEMIRLEVPVVEESIADIFDEFVQVLEGDESQFLKLNNFK